MKCKVCGKDFIGLGDTCISCSAKKNSEFVSDKIESSLSGKVAAGLFAVTNPYAAAGLYVVSKFAKNHTEDDSITERQSEPAMTDTYHEAQCAYKLENYNKVRDICDEGLKNCVEGNELQTQLYFYKYKALDKLGSSIKEVRRNCLPVMLNATNEMLYENDNLKNYATSDFEEYDNDYIAGFLNQPYTERNLLVPVKEYKDLSQENISIINIKKISKSGINFPIGHPIPYHLYIGHPSSPQIYIPFEDYELEFLVDKFNDFCHLVFCLGATEVKIMSENRRAKENNSRKGRDVSGGLSKPGVAGGEVACHGDSRLRFEERIESRIGLHHTNTPSVAPYVPDDMHWTDSVWNHIIRDRMYGNGHLNGTYRYKIETSSIRMFNSSDIRSIKTEFESIYVGGKGAWTKEDDKKFFLSENASLSIEVTFAPFEELTNDSAKTIARPTTSNICLTSNELEYIEEIKACLAKDSRITKNTQRLLDKIRDRLGISEAKAKELEENLSPQLTDDEKDYLDEYKECFRESGCKLSDSERRLLDKLRSKLGITIERAEELEKLF